MKVIKLSEADIRTAMTQTNSCAAAARFLKITTVTFRKYASMMFDTDGISLYEKHKNQSGVGIPKFQVSHAGDTKLLNKILNNESISTGSSWKIKQVLVRSGILLEKCDICGFQEARITDGKIPLLICYIDGNSDNLHIDNLQLLCLNCYFLTYGTIRGIRI